MPPEFLPRNATCRSLGYPGPPGSTICHLLVLQKESRGATRQGAEEAI
jgi:hypothetical protein